jgi:hypothetical protein
MRLNPLRGVFSQAIEVDFSVVDGRGPCWLSVVGCWLHGGFAAAAIWVGYNRAGFWPHCCGLRHKIYFIYFLSDLFCNRYLGPIQRPAIEIEVIPACFFVDAKCSTYYINSA